MGTHTDNKTGDDLKAQRFQMLEDIAKELSGEVVFPTYFDAVLRLRKVLQDPNETIGGIATAVSLEPLISAKLLHLANSVAFNPQGNQVVDLKSAVSRLGLNAVRSAALSIVMAQLLRAKGMASFADLIAHVAKSRPLTAGTLVGSGTIANEDTSKGASCLAEQRTVETLRDGKPATPFLKFGDRVKIDITDQAGRSVFGAIEQVVKQYVPA